MRLLCPNFPPVQISDTETPSPSAQGLRTIPYLDAIFTNAFPIITMQVSQYELVLHKDSNWKIVG